MEWTTTAMGSRIWRTTARRARPRGQALSGSGACYYEAGPHSYRRMWRFFGPWSPAPYRSSASYAAASSASEIGVHGAPGAWLCTM